MLLTCLLHGSLLTLNTDLTKISGEMRGVAPDYFLNVPALLERMRKAVDEQLWTDWWNRSKYLHSSQRRVDTEAGRTCGVRGCHVAEVGQCHGVSDHPQENDRFQPQGPHLRVGAA